MTLSPVNVQPSEPLPAQRLAPVAAVPTPNPAKAALPRPEKLTPPKPASTPEPPLAATAPSTPPISNRAAAALSAIDLMNRGIQMARLDSAKPEANGSREKRIDQESTTTLEKFYMQAWERKVEQVGTLNFPEEARRLNLTTGPVLDVAIRADGGVHSITLVRSSGHPELDKAARRIIELAAPYAAFPPELRRQYDVLHIVRKWRFEQGRLLQK
jgi:protein TonB